MDTGVEHALCVHKKNGNIMNFKEHTNGLHFFDTRCKYSPAPTNNLTSLLQLVEDNKKLFVKREIDATDAAWDLYRKIGRPSEAKVEEIVSKNLILNCPVTIDDVRRALAIYGPDINTFKGKTVCGEAASHVPNYQAIPIPMPILQYHENVTLCADFFTSKKGKCFYISYPERCNTGL
jgi:hypothetical protein